MGFAQVVRSYYDRLLLPVLETLSRLKVHPNALTVIGLLVNGVAALQFAGGRVRSGGLLILGAGIFDSLDGALARYSRRTSPFGAFLDSTIDRYSDMSLLIGVLIFFLRRSETGHVLLTCVTLAGFVMVSYTRARAECLIPHCTVGLMERAERLILLSLGALLNALPAFLWLLAILSHLTALQRIHYTWKKIRDRQGDQSPEETT